MQYNGSKGRKDVNEGLEKRKAELWEFCPTLAVEVRHHALKEIIELTDYTHRLSYMLFSVQIAALLSIELAEFVIW